MNILIFRSMLLLGLLAAGLPAPVQPQEERPVSLEQAVEEARRGSLDVQAAKARAQAARHGLAAASAYLWPKLAVEAGAMRSNDPVAAFGSRLRQERFTTEDFDPARLNRPGAVADWSGAIGATWAPLDLPATAAREAASHEAAAAELGSTWAERAAEFRARVRYLEAVGAGRRLRATDAALEAATENARLVRRRRDEGVLTDVDLMQAQAALEAARARLIGAEKDLADARERLGVALGWPQRVTPVPTDTTFEVPSMSQAVVGSRPDLRASEVGLQAAGARVQQARRARLPVVFGFARLETHAPRAFSEVHDDWALGFQVRVPVFAGFALSARERAAGAALEAAQREHALRVREAEADDAAARRALDAARLGLRAAEAGAEAAEEAARLMRRRFDEGLATTADLLAVEAQAAELSARAVDARLAVHLAAARLAFLAHTNADDSDRGSDR
jgi:outer membrane protein TolC